jgi:hypothetical protein
MSWNQISTLPLGFRRPARRQGYSIQNISNSPEAAAIQVRKRLVENIMAKEVHSAG